MTETTTKPLRIALVRPGATDFDEQKRIRGTLAIPLNGAGTDQVVRAVAEMRELDLQAIYSSPCQVALETAAILADQQGLKVKRIEKLKNLDHGLWHGKLISDLKQNQPKAYRQLQDYPESVCPPGGEPVETAQNRVQKALVKILKKHKTGVIALVVSEPLASLAQSLLTESQLGNLWKSECECGSWELIDVDSHQDMTRLMNMAR